MSNSKRLEQLLDMLNKNSDSFLLFAIAKEYEKAADQVLAIEYYKRLLNEFPNYVGTYYHFGKLLEKKGETDEAIETYSKGMSIARAAGDQHSLSELAEAKLNLED
jgi:tetratricopeptide (TPR) repeat protein